VSTIRLLPLVSLLAIAVPTATIAQPATPAATAPTSAKLSAFFEAYDKAQLARSPMGKSYRGIRDGDYGKLDQQTDAESIANRAFDQKWIDDMVRRFPRASLSPADQLSYDLFLDRNARAVERFGFRRNGYIFDQMNGAQSSIPAFLINIHSIANEDQAKAYISRIRASRAYLDQSVDEAIAREKLGVLPPKWVFPHVLEQSRNLIKGAPFDGGPDNDVFADFKTKVGKLDLSQARKDALIAEARTAMLESMKPAYERVIRVVGGQQARAPTADGVWRFKDGAAYYQTLLKGYTTTSLTGDQVHALGLAQVARIHGEMDAIRQKVGFKGTLRQFFDAVRDDPKNYYSNDAAGRDAYLKANAEAQTRVEAALPRYFGTLPKAPLLIKPVEPFREKSAGKAFYNSPAPDGSRPGIYYVNLYDMKEMPSIEAEALFCHEGTPGHHLQFAILSNLPKGSVPPFRQFGGYTANSEGWGLYAEKLCKEMGLYQSPMSDFGRLQLELHRAMRLVVDSGLHHKRWSREQAIAYIRENSADKGIAKAIERYIVYPGQATAYMVGKLKIEELRAKAKATLGARYDDRQFHDTLLLAGTMPLDLLEKRIDEWIARTRA
jgi:uncharacterized protein (DUF885 family)